MTMTGEQILQELRQPGYASDMTRRLADELEFVLRNKDEELEYLHSVRERRGKQIEDLEEEVEQLKEKLKGATETISLLMTFNENHRRTIDNQAGELELLRQAAQAVVIRWNTPRWKDTEATAVYINLLQEASK